jgi:urease accessory protein
MKVVFMWKSSGLSVFLILFVFAPDSALAHTQLVGGGFVTGLQHPVLGIDHFLAMISVGVISVMMGRHAVWIVPAVFVLVMSAGGALGMNGVDIPLVEYGIAISVVVLGLAITLHEKLSLPWVMLIVGFFAVFHGHAHGVEMPWTASPYLYAGGFVTGTAAIHLFGVLIGSLLSGNAARLSVLRYTGSAVAGVGAHILWLHGGL